MDYRPVPFWFLNHRLEKDELKRQIALMRDCGVSGFFMHSRAGLKTPYGSDDWFRKTRFIVDEAARAGLKAWLYDEDPFPSGAAGGGVFFEHPEFAARGIHFHEFIPDAEGFVSADIGHGKVLEAVAVRCSADGETIDSFDVSAHIGIIRPDYFMTPWHNAYYIQLREHAVFDHYRAETFNPRLRIEYRLPSPDYRIRVCCADIELSDSKFGLIPDNLNPDCVRAFLDATHEKYREYCGDEFGKTIPGIFTDETNPGGAMPWTARLEETFEEMHRYPLAGHYHQLFAGSTAEARRLRRHYWETVQQLFENAFFRPVAEWCGRNSLMLCGHLISEEDPLAMVDISRLQKYFELPGFDQITFNIPNGDFFSLNLGGRLIASAALREGKKQVLCECFGCNPFNFGVPGMKKIANWLFSLGINLLVPHGFHYSIDGYRKHDAGKSFFFQDPEFTHFGAFAQYAERIGSRLGGARSLNHVAVLVPLSAMRALYPAERSRAEAMREDLYRLCRNLTERQMQFDILDETALLAGVIDGNTLTCGQQRYNAVLTPSDCRELLAPDVGEKLNQLPVPQTESLPQGAGVIQLQVQSGSLAAQYLLVKEIPDGLQVYNFNNSPEPAVLEFDCRRPGLRPFLYDADTDASFELTDGRCTAGGFDAVLIEYRPSPPADTRPYLMPELPPRREYEFERAPEWDYTPPVPGLIAKIDRWAVRFDEESCGSHSFRLFRDMRGTELPHLRGVRPIFDQTPVVPSRYPVRAELTAEFELRDTAGTLELVMESESISGDCRIYLNDREIPRTGFERRFVYDPGNLCCRIGEYCRAGTNRLRLVWERGGEFDGLRSMFYLFQR